MNHHHTVRSLFDRIPFAVRALLAGSLALSMLFLSAALGLLLLAFAVGATPGRHVDLTRPARVIEVELVARAKTVVERALAGSRIDATGIGGCEGCPLMADEPGPELPRRLLLRTFIRHTFE